MEKGITPDRNSPSGNSNSQPGRAWYSGGETTGRWCIKIGMARNDCADCTSIAPGLGPEALAQVGEPPMKTAVCRSGRNWTAVAMALLAATLVPLALAQEADQKGAGTGLQQQVQELVEQLDADTVAERDIAESNLLSLADEGGIDTAELLKLIPPPTDNMPPAVRQRVTTIRRTLEARLAREATDGARVTIEAINWKLSDVLAKLQEESGNRVLDGREQFNQEVTNPEILLTVDKAFFWEALDQVLDQAQLSINNYAGEDAISLIQREPGEVDRYGRAAYTGPFRFEVTELNGVRGLRNPQRDQLQVELEIAWEPRLRPIAIGVPLDLMEAVDERGEPMPVAQPGRVFNIEVQEGSCATTIQMPFKLPDRSVGAIARLRGALGALVPGKRHEFRFENLKSPTPITQTVGGVHVTLDKVMKNNDIWEVHMRLKLDDDNESLASHRGWVFNNLNYLEGKDGQPIDNAGFETTLQSEREVGIAYFFDLPEGIEGLTWVYKSPVAIVQQEYQFELSAIELP
jgi:hypothetical protein